MSASATASSIASAVSSATSEIITSIPTATATTLVVVGGSATPSTGFGGNATSTAGGPAFTGAATKEGLEMSVLGLVVFVVGGLVL